MPSNINTTAGSIDVHALDFTTNPGLRPWAPTTASSHAAQGNGDANAMHVRRSTYGAMDRVMVASTRVQRCGTGARHASGCSQMRNDVCTVHALSANSQLNRDVPSVTHRRFAWAWHLQRLSPQYEIRS
jgi:hypothetical protein